MQIALLPTINEVDKASLERWLRLVLGNARLSTTTANFPLSEDKITIYVDGHAKGIYRGGWSDQGNLLYIGQDSTQFDLGARLGVLAAIISVANLWDQLTDLYSTAVSKVLLESYNSAMQGLIRLNGGGPATGLAFNSDRSQVAALVGEAWVLPNGQEIALDHSWTVVQ